MVEFVGLVVVKVVVLVVVGAVIFVVVEVMGFGLNEHVSRQKFGPYELYRA